MNAPAPKKDLSGPTAAVPDQAQTKPETRPEAKPAETPAAKPAETPAAKPAATPAAPGSASAPAAAPASAPGPSQAPSTPRAPEPPVPPARLKRRHWVVAASFVLMVLLPVTASAWYLWTRAVDRYVSYIAFSVRTEETSSAFELLGGMAELSGSSSKDTDILYQFIQSQELVARIDDAIDLRAIWSKPGYGWDEDPVFAYHPPGTIEDLTEYWNDMVSVYSDNGTGLLDLEVQAFTPEDAHLIAERIYAESSDMINELSAIARSDATRYAREELDQTIVTLKESREALTRFRNRTQIVDPTASIQGQMGLISSLQAQLAQTLIDLDLLRENVSENDPRIQQGERRVLAIERRIEEERRKLGIGTASADGEAAPGSAFADLVGEYERLAVDREVAERSYTSALSTYESAIAEARRQSRYLAAHVKPTLAQAAVEPKRQTLVALIGIFCFLGWAMLVLTLTALRDRR